jgi:hypothetical protein
MHTSMSMRALNVPLVLLVLLVHAVSAQNAALLRGDSGILKVLDRVDSILDKEMNLLAADAEKKEKSNSEHNGQEDRLALAHQNRMIGWSDIKTGMKDLPLMAKKWVKGHQCIWFVLKCSIAVLGMAVPGLGPALLATLITIKIVDTLIAWTDIIAKSKENWQKFDDAGAKGVITGAMVQQCKAKDATGASIKAVVGAFWSWCSVVLPLEPVEAFIGVDQANDMIQSASHFKAAVDSAFENAGATAEQFKVEKAFAQGAGATLTSQIEGKTRAVLTQEAVKVVLSCEDILKDADTPDTDEAWYEITLDDHYPATPDKVPTTDNPLIPSETIKKDLGPSAEDEKQEKEVVTTSLYKKFIKRMRDWNDGSKKVVHKVMNTCPFLLTNNGPEEAKDETAAEFTLVTRTDEI